MPTYFSQAKTYKCKIIIKFAPRVWAIKYYTVVDIISQSVRHFGPSLFLRAGPLRGLHSYCRLSKFNFKSEV
jgi:hypothetical protein